MSFEKHNQLGLSKGSLGWCWLSLFIILLDQASKYLALSFLLPYQSKPVFPLFNLSLVFNRGAAFSFLSNSGDLATWLFSIVALVMSAFILFWLNRLPPTQRWQACALALILGGALGNLLDRIARRQVVDFLDFYFRSWHFPAFNIADAAITIGAVMLLMGILRNFRE